MRVVKIVGAGEAPAPFPELPADFHRWPLGAAAIEYASHGWWVFPLAPRAKCPLKGSHGLLDATTDPKRILEWWSLHPNSNVGISTGPSRLIVLDVDAKSGGFETLKELFTRYGEPPPTATARSGSGGLHLYYKTPAGVDVPSCTLGPGLEVKAAGGAIVAPPSVHPNGNQYRWETPWPEVFSAVTEAPGWVLKLIRERKAQAKLQTASERTQQAASAPASGARGVIPEGRRNVELTAIGGYLRGHGLPYDGLARVLRIVNESLCSPPLPDHEVESIARSLTRYSPGDGQETPEGPRIFESLDEDELRLVLPKLAAELHLTHIRLDGYTWRGQLTVRCNLPTARSWEGLVLSGEINLSSPRGRAEIAKLLAQRIRVKDVDWQNILEHLSAKAIDNYRNSSRAVDLAEVPPEPEDEGWEVAGLWLPRKAPTLIYGDGGTSKSYLALWVLTKLAAQGFTSLYVDWEWDRTVHNHRLRLLGGAEKGRIHYYRAKLPLVQEVDRIREEIKSTGAQYLVLDSAALACAGPPESAEAALGFFQALRKLDRGNLVIAHCNRTSEQKPFGSAFWYNSARQIYLAKAGTRPGGNAPLLVGLFNKKSNYGPLRPALAFELTFLPDRTEVKRVGLENDQEFTEHLSLAERMRLALLQGAKSTAELASELGTTEATIRNVLRRRPDMFTRLPDGRLGLKVEEEEVVL